MESIDFGSNWVPIARYTADLLGLAYDRSTGFVNLLPQATALIPPIRLANKQIVPRTPEFQCPNSTCWIPRAFLNDDFCDCPGCEDEEFHRCEDCGVGLPSFVDDVCPDRRCKLYGSGLTLNNLFYVTRQACLGTGLVTDPFTCPDPNGGISGCIINKSLVDDLRCDCPGTCADEADYTCENCSVEKLKLSWFVPHANVFVAMRNVVGSHLSVCPASLFSMKTKSYAPNLDSETPETPGQHVTEREAHASPLKLRFLSDFLWPPFPLVLRSFHWSLWMSRSSALPRAMRYTRVPSERWDLRLSMDMCGRRAATKFSWPGVSGELWLVDTDSMVVAAGYQVFPKGDPIGWLLLTGTCFRSGIWRAQIRPTSQRVIRFLPSMPSLSAKKHVAHVQMGGAPPNQVTSAGVLPRATRLTICEARGTCKDLIAGQKFPLD